MVSVYVIISNKLYILSISIRAQIELNKIELPPASTPHVPESIGALVDRDLEQRYVWVCVFASMSIEQYVKATAVSSIKVYSLH